MKIRSRIWSAENSQTLCKVQTEADWVPTTCMDVSSMGVQNSTMACLVIATLILLIKMLVCLGPEKYETCLIFLIMGHNIPSS